VQSGKTPLQVAEEKEYAVIATLIHNPNAADASELVLMRKERQEFEKERQEFEQIKVVMLEKEGSERDIVGKDLPTIIKAVQTNLVRKSPEGTRMVGTLKDLLTGTFSDSAYGFKEFLEVPTGWDEKEECEVPKLEEEVRRIADCVECAKVQVPVLQVMVDEGIDE
jgi:hypothetical protein